MKRKIKAGDEVMVKYSYKYTCPVSSHKVHLVEQVNGDKLKLIGDERLLESIAFELYK